MPTNNDATLRRLAALAEQRLAGASEPQKTLPSLAEWDAQLTAKTGRTRGKRKPEGHTLSDYGNLFGSGAAQLGGAVSTLADMATGGAVTEASEKYLGKSLTQMAADKSDEFQQELSPAMRESMQRRFISDKEGEAFGSAWGDPHAIGGNIVQSSPSFLLGGGFAGAGAKAGASLAARNLAGQAAKKAAVKGAKVGGTVGGAVGEGTIEAGFAAQELEERMRGEVTPEEWLKSPRVQQYMQAGLNLAEAKEATIRDAKRMAALKTGSISAITGGVFGKFVGDLVSKSAGKAAKKATKGGKQAATQASSRAKDAGKGLLVESGTEFIQEGSSAHNVEQAMVDEFAREYNLRDVLNQATAGAVAGGVQGGVLGGIAGGDGGAISKATDAGQKPRLMDRLLRRNANDDEGSGGQDGGQNIGHSKPPVELSEARQERLRSFIAAISQDERHDDQTRKAAVERLILELAREQRVEDAGGPRPVEEEVAEAEAEVEAQEADEAAVQQGSAESKRNEGRFKEEMKLAEQAVKSLDNHRKQLEGQLNAAKNDGDEAKVGERQKALSQIETRLEEARSRVQSLIDRRQAEIDTEERPPEQGKLNQTQAPQRETPKQATTEPKPAAAEQAQAEAPAAPAAADAPATPAAPSKKAKASKPKEQPKREPVLTQPAEDVPTQAEPAQAAPAGDKPKGRVGKKQKTYTPNNTEVETQFELAEADDLITSHDFDGNENPDFPAELQIRDRSRRASKDKLEKMAREFIPARVGGESNLTTDGAPIVGEDNLVESGNGRVNVLRERVYKGDKAEEYVQYLRDNAEALGLDPAEIDNMDFPVLIRRRKGEMAPDERSSYTDDSNESTSQGLSEYELAVSDARKITPEMLAKYRPTQKGEILNDANQQFVNRFLQDVIKGDLTEYQDADGFQNDALARRIKNAVFQAVYGDQDMTEFAIESASGSLKKVVSALSRAAPRMAKLKGSTARFNVADLNSLVLGAVDVLQAADAKDASVEAYVKQLDMLDQQHTQDELALALWLDANSKSELRMADAFSTLADTLLEDVAAQAQGGLGGDFGDKAPPATLRAILENASKKLTEKYGDGQEDQGDLLKQLQQAREAADRARRDAESARGDDDGGQQDGQQGAAAADAEPGAAAASATEGEQSEWEAFVEDLDDQEVEALWKEGKFTEDAPEIEDRKAVFLSLNETGQDALFDLYIDLADQNALGDYDAEDQYGADEDWDVGQIHFTASAPEKKVNATKEAGEYISQEEADARLAEWKAEAKRMGEEEDHSNEVIISLFDASGQAAQPWRDAGYTVYQYDLESGDDLLRFFPTKDLQEISESGKKVVGVIAQPPCTCFSSSGARWWKGRHDKHDRAILSKMFGPWAARYFSKPKEYTKALVSIVDLAISFTEPGFFVMENPVGRIATQMGLPQPAMMFDPHVYGNPYTKRTQLWGNFNTDLPTANVYPTEGSLIHKMWSTAEEFEGARSLTPEGWAYAFFMANKTEQQALDYTDADVLNQELGALVPKTGQTHLVGTLPAVVENEGEFLWNDDDDTGHFHVPIGKPVPIYLHNEGDGTYEVSYHIKTGVKDGKPIVEPVNKTVTAKPADTLADLIRKVGIVEDMGFASYSAPGSNALPRAEQPAQAREPGKFTLRSPASDGSTNSAIVSAVEGEDGKWYAVSELRYTVGRNSGEQNTRNQSPAYESKQEAIEAALAQAEAFFSKKVRGKGSKAMNAQREEVLAWVREQRAAEKGGQADVQDSAPAGGAAPQDQVVAELVPDEGDRHQIGTRPALIKEGQPFRYQNTGDVDIANPRPGEPSPVYIVNEGDGNYAVVTHATGGIENGQLRVSAQWLNAKLEDGATVADLMKAAYAEAIQADVIYAEVAPAQEAAPAEPGTQTPDAWTAMPNVAELKQRRGEDWVKKHSAKKRTQFLSTQIVEPSNSNTPKPQAFKKTRSERTTVDELVEHTVRMQVWLANIETLLQKASEAGPTTKADTEAGVIARDVRRAKRLTDAASQLREAIDLNAVRFHTMNENMRENAARVEAQKKAAADQAVQEINAHQRPGYMSWSAQYMGKDKSRVTLRGDKGRRYRATVVKDRTVDGEYSIFVQRQPGVGKKFQGAGTFFANTEQEARALAEDKVQAAWKGDQSRDRDGKPNLEAEQPAPAPKQPAQKRKQVITDTGMEAMLEQAQKAKQARDAQRKATPDVVIGNSEEGTEAHVEMRPDGKWGVRLKDVDSDKFLDSARIFADYDQAVAHAHKIANIKDEGSLFKRRQMATRIAKDGSYRVVENRRLEQKIAKLAEVTERTWGERLDLRPVRLLPNRGNREARRIERVFKHLFGREVVFFESSDPNAPDGVVDKNQPDTIFVNVNSSAPFRVVMGHEFLHTLRKQDEQLYQQIMAAIDGYMQNQSGYAERLLRAYEQDGLLRAPGGALITEEYIADAFGAVFMEPGTLRELEYMMEPSAFRKVVNTLLAWLDRLVEKLRGPKTRFAARYINDMGGMRQLALDAMRQHAANYIVPTESLHADAAAVVDEVEAMMARKDDSIPFMSRLYPAEKKMVQRFLRNHPDGKSIRAELKKHAGTPWEKQSLLGIVTQQSIRDIIAGKEVHPSDQNPLFAPKSAGMLAAVRKGVDGMFGYMEFKSGQGFISHPSKSENAVNASFKNCKPSADCAAFCYAANGRALFHSNIARTEFTDFLVEQDPKRAAEIIGKQYSMTENYRAQQALRMFEKGDISPAYVELIKHLGAIVPDEKYGPIRLQVFSKNPELLRQLPDTNVRMLSIDQSNFDMAAANPDLDIALVFNGSPELVDIAHRHKERIAVVLPIKAQGKAFLGEQEGGKNGLKALPKELRQHVCPVDAGHVMLKDEGKRALSAAVERGASQAELERIRKKVWNCTKCDKGVGMGCFHGSVTAQVLARLERPIESYTTEETADARAAIEAKVDDLVKRGVVGASHKQTVVEELLELLPPHARREDAGATRGVDEHLGSPADGTRAPERGLIPLHDISDNDDGSLFMRRTRDMEYGSEWTAPEHNLWGATKRLFQNQFVRFKEIQQAIIDAGGEITEDMDVEQAELHVKGAIAEDLRDIRQSIVLPVVQLLAEHGITLSEFDAYLYARHAGERNDHIWEINPEFREFGIPGSGMSHDEAQLILDDFDAQGKTGQLEAAASIVDGMNAERLDMMIHAGLESRENIDMWRSRYEHYVPLKGTQDGRHVQRIRPGKGFDMSGKNLIAAFGRRNQADSPFMNAVLQMQETAMRARKADVGQKLYRLMGAYHNEDVYQLYSPQQKLRPRFNSQTGEVEYVPDHQLPDDVIRVRVDGKVKHIKLVDPMLLRAFKRLHDNDISRVEQALLRVNRYLSTVNTSLNPEFLVSNIARDFQTALHGIAAERDIGKLQGQSLRQMAKRMTKELPGALRGIYSTLRKETHGGKLNIDHDGNTADDEQEAPSEWERWFHRYRQSGAMTGFYDMRDMESMKDEIESLIKEAHGGKMASLRKAFRLGKDAVANLNSAAENATRLVAFRIAIEQGNLSEREAATLARTLTVNFNRRGELGVVMNAMYLFYNAGIQGTAQMIKAMRSPSVQRIAAGTVAFAFTLAMINRAAAGEDDDGENLYDLLPDSILERNMVIARGDGKWITIPLPYGYNIFHVIGTQLARIAQGKSAMSSSLAVVRAAATSFMPIATDSSADASTFFLKMLSPTISDPLVELAVNENAFGAPIYRSRPDFGGNQVPASQLPMRNTSETAKWFADFANRMSGGNEVYAGWADISPDALEHLVEFATGAAGAFTSRTVRAAGNLFSDEETEIKDVPFLRRAMAETPDWTATQRFYEAVRMVDAAGDVRKHEASKPYGEREPLPDELEAVQHLTGRLKRVNSRLQVLYKRRARVLGDQRLDDDAREDRVEEISEEIKRLQKQFGLQYEKARQKG